MHGFFIWTTHHSAKFFIHRTKTTDCRSEMKKKEEINCLHTNSSIVIIISFLVFFFAVKRIKWNVEKKSYNLVGKKLGESSLFFKMSLHLLTVSNSKNVSPTENNVDKQLAKSLRVGGPGDPWIWVVNCSTNFFWHAFIYD